jgi:GNAT superfamily N-acetyltransferase
MTIALTLQSTDTAESPVFDVFFKAYERAFVLPDEMEDRDGFATCLSLNHGAAKSRLTAQYGDFHEACVVAHDASEGTLIGGANFIAMPNPEADGRALITANLNYLFVVETARGKGYFRVLYAAVARFIAELFSDAAQPTLIFIEQNDPFLLTPEDYMRDTELTGIDQVDRLAIWTKVGAKLVDFPYVQPALSSDQLADHNLVYSVLGTTGDALPAPVLAHHLRMFFGVSVLKGQALGLSPEVTEQLSLLDSMKKRGESVPLVDLSGRFDEMATARLAGHRRLALRDWLHSDQASG